MSGSLAATIEYESHVCSGESITMPNHGRSRLVVAGWTLLAGAASAALVFAVASRTFGSGPERQSVASAERSRAANGDMTLDELRAFPGFPVYWIGEEYGGLPLTRIIRHVFTPSPSSFSRGENVVLLLYGECQPPPNGGCAPPLSIRIEPACDSRQADLPVAAIGGAVTEIRGAPAAKVSGHLQIWARDVTVSVFAPNDALTSSVANAIEPVNAARLGLPTTTGLALSAPVASC